MQKFFLASTGSNFGSFVLIQLASLVFNDILSDLWFLTPIFVLESYS